MTGKEETFEQALAKLEAIVRDIEEGKIGLEESIKRYEDGMNLLSRCRGILAQAEMKIQKLQAKADGEIQAEPPEVQTPQGK